MKYAETHEWILIDDQGIGTVGVSEHARKELGEVVYVQLPEVGKLLKKNDEACVLESTKAAADIYSPVTGTVVSINELNEKNIDKLNTSPEQKGWLFKVRLDHPEEIETLLSREDYLKEVSSK